MTGVQTCALPISHDFPAGRYFKALGRGLLGSDAFWTSHKSVNLLSKRARNIGGAAHLIKLYFKYLIGSAAGSVAWVVDRNLRSGRHPRILSRIFLTPLARGVVYGSQLAPAP